MSFTPGEPVNVSYTGYTVHGVVVQSPELDERGRERRGWTLIRQDYETADPGTREGMGDYRDEAEEDRPVFGAADEYIYRDGEPVPGDPLEDLRLAMLTGIDVRIIAANRRV